MPTQTQTKSKTQVTTGILIISAATIGLAAGIGLLTINRDMTPQYRPGMFNVKNIGKLNPGYLPSGYQAKAVTCTKDGFDVAPYTGTLAAIPKSSLIKYDGGAAIYWYAKDGKRYVFPDYQTYLSWYGPSQYTGCPPIREVSLALITQIQIGGNVHLKPFWSWAKITTDKKAYAISKGGVLHWVTNEVLASQLVQPDWRKSVRDVPDAFFVNYTVGSSISSKEEWGAQMKASAEVKTIDQDLGL